MLEKNICEMAKCAVVANFPVIDRCPFLMFRDLLSFEIHSSLDLQNNDKVAFESQKYN